MACAAGSAASATVLSLDGAEDCRNSVIHIPVNLNGALEPVTGLQFDIVYDTAVVRTTDLPCLLGSDMPAGMPASAVHVSFPLDPPVPAGWKRLRVLVLDTDCAMTDPPGTPLTFGNGEVVRCDFVIGQSAPIGYSTLLTELPVVTDADGEPLDEVTATDGTVVVDSCTGGC